jgi:hypothetical protein
LLTLLQDIFDRVRDTHDPASGTANELLVQLTKRGDRGFRFRSLKEARCHCNVALLLDLQIAVWEEGEARKGGIVRLSDSAKRTLMVH